MSAAWLRLRQPASAIKVGLCTGWGLGSFAPYITLYFPGVTNFAAPLLDTPVFFRHRRRRPRRPAPRAPLPQGTVVTPLAALLAFFSSFLLRLLLFHGATVRPDVAYRYILAQKAHHLGQRRTAIVRLTLEALTDCLRLRRSLRVFRLFRQAVHGLAATVQAVVALMDPLYMAAHRLDAVVPFRPCPRQYPHCPAPMLPADSLFAGVVATYHTLVTHVSAAEASLQHDYDRAVAQATALTRRYLAGPTYF